MALTALTDWNYYNGTYKTTMGNVTVPQADFPRYVMRASAEVRRVTFGNINENKEIPESVQCCCCELAEYMYSCDQRDMDTNGVASEKDGTWSVTYESAEKKKEVDRREIQKIIYNYLAQTGLLYCGV